MALSGGLRCAMMVLLGLLMAPSRSEAYAEQYPSEQYYCEDHGVLSEFGPWTCVDTCGYTVEFRNRTCDRDPNYYGGEDCPADCGGADLGEQRECDAGCCPHVGVFSEWTTWTCEDSCGYTKQFRNRTCVESPDYPVYQDCKPECDGPLSEEEECDAGCCGNDGVWSEWNGGHCEADNDCGYGRRRLTRQCIQDPHKPETYSDCEPMCHGNNEDYEDCYAGCCKQDELWGTWSQWNCQTEYGCGYGTQDRHRECINNSHYPDPECEEGCGDGETYQQDDCYAGCCEQDEKWAEWGEWFCGVTCGYGVQTRYRECINYSHYADKECENGCKGEAYEQDHCDAGCCDHYGVVSEWTTWTCLDSCGYTTEYRNRTCENNPDFEAYHKCPPKCVEDLSEVAECDAGCCDIAGVWSEWYDEGCDADCGYGHRRRYRSCQPDPYAEASYSDCEPMCHGPNEDYAECNAGCCDQDEQWSSWTDWACDVSCGYGTETRHRDCINHSHYPDPDCEKGCGDGDLYEQQDCYPGCCDQEERYGEWSEWEGDVTCGYGQRNRHRECKNYSHYPDPNCLKGCEGESYQSEAYDAGCCDQDEHWTSWSQWSCDVTCGYGSQTRSRECKNYSHYPNSECENGCKGEPFEYDHCDAGCCEHIGVLSSWTTWTCLASCGYTSEYRNRTCQNDPDYYYYHDCPASCDGPLSEENECDAGCCDNAGVWSTWYDYPCDAECGYGNRRRTRTCEQDPNSPASYSDCTPECYGPNEDNEECNAGCCDQDEQWTTWSDWECDVSCGYGTETRHRECINHSHYPNPECEKGCGDGDIYQTQDCNAGCCEQDEQWTQWSAWNCDATCGYGTASRHRECQNYGHYPDSDCEKGCPGEPYQTEDCNAGCCKQDEQWTQWGEWVCDVTCGYGTKHRSRECINNSHYPDSMCENGCKGEGYEQDHCDAGCCEHIGVLSQWSTWTCLDSCGYTTEYRNRSCESDPDFQAYHNCPPKCDGDLSEEAECDAGCCDTDGVWSEWYDDGCDADCGYGHRRRYRTCQPDPYAAASYSDCEPMCHGPNEDYQECNAGCCDQVEQWSTWTDWACDVTCGYGTETRHRDCINLSHYPDPECEKGCGYEEAYQQQDCYPGCCDQDEKYTEWSTWEGDVTCGYGHRTRHRECKNYSHYPDPNCLKGCQGEEYQSEPFDAGCCDQDEQWTSWSEWNCDVTCGYGTKSRSRECINYSHYPNSDCQNGCKGAAYEEDHCDAGCCEHVGVLSSWTTWTCLASCGYTSEYRNRTCQNDPDFYGYHDCPPSCNGPLSEENECDAGCCDNPGVWSSWYEYPCDAECGYGNRRRTRTCEQDPNGPASYSDCSPMCYGPNEDNEECNAGCCDQDERYGEWSTWECDVTCGYGTQTRHRECINYSHYPDPKCAKGCGDGDIYESQDCNPGCCEQDEQWTQWSNWVCDVTCGYGTQTRTRDCRNNGHYPDSKCEKGCPGEGYQTEDCNAGCCDLRGEWDSWTNWACADECGYTQEYRNRTCINPHGHDPHYADCEVSCRGDDSDEASCFNGCCPHVGVLSEWSTWTCLDSCGYTTEYRNRTCLNDPGFYGYEDCPPECDGPLSQENECDAGCCGNPGVWSQWYSEECDAKCGYGQRRRYRTCEQDPYADESYSDCEPECHGPNEDFEACSAGCCDQEEKWGKWSRWSCDVTCGYGTQTRHRECENLSHYPDPKCAKGCGYGEAYQSGPCDAGCCESIPDGYGEWSYCSSSCGPGTRHREVFCQDNGYHCPCDLPKEEQPCYSGDCDVDQCVCRLLGDPIVETFVPGEFSLLTKAKLFTLSEQRKGDCAFSVEVQIGDYGNGGLIVPKYLTVTLNGGRTVVQFNEDHQFEVIKSKTNSAGVYDGRGRKFKLDNVGYEVDVIRNGDFLVIIDNVCGTKVGYDSEGLYTTATIVVAQDNAEGLKGECGDCGNY